MLQNELLISLMKYVLPEEMVEYFDLKNIDENGEVLYLYFTINRQNKIFF
jgi:hypothetical protein